MIAAFYVACVDTAAVVLPVGVLFFSFRGTALVLYVATACAVFFRSSTLLSPIPSAFLSLTPPRSLVRSFLIRRFFGCDRIFFGKKGDVI